MTWHVLRCAIGSLTSTCSKANVYSTVDAMALYYCSVAECYRYPFQAGPWTAGTEFLIT